VDLTIGTGMLAGYFLALGRTVGFILTAPPFSTRGIPRQARAAAALALAVPLSVWTTPDAPALNSGELISQFLLQFVTGTVLGTVVMFAVAAIQTVGDLIDVAGGFSITAGLDPLLLVQSSVMGRLHQLVAVTLLFVGNGHLVVLHGLTRSFELMPGPDLSLEAIARALAASMSGMFLAAIQIVAPILAALLIADLALGLLTRAAPALNAFALAFPIKIALSLLLIGLILTQIPGALEIVIRDASVNILQLSGG
jgi:flagellar biosynthetic protein FliR